MNLPALDHVAHHSQEWVTPKLELNSIGQGIPKLGMDNMKFHSTTGRIFSKVPLTPTTHKISFPTCLSHLGNIHLHYSIVHRLIHFPSKSSRTCQIMNSQSSLTIIGLPPGELTSSTHSLTWREFLAGLTTCFFYPHSLTWESY